MAEGKQWDLTSTNSLQAAAGWLLKRAGENVLFVAIVRVDDLAIAGDPKLAPKDVLHVFEDRLPQLHDVLEAERKAALAKADKAANRKTK